MPDWSYLPVFQPLLFRLPASVARDRTLAGFGALARLPGGRLLIRGFGDLQPPPAVRFRRGGLVLSSPVGLGAGLDQRGMALLALAELGFGYLEVGPVASHAQPEGGVQRDIQRQALLYAAPLPAIDLAGALTQLARLPTDAAAVMVRLRLDGSDPPTFLTSCLTALAPRVAALTIELPICSPDDTSAYLRRFAEARQTSGCAMLVSLPPDTVPAAACAIAREAMQRGFRGVQVAGGLTQSDATRLTGAPARARARALA
jgi:dihydroorotate dehydrogenase